ncbi:hypothetical protein HK096_009805, partial [Nowakowskiella sp. JEL0078]
MPPHEKISTDRAAHDWSTSELSIKGRWLVDNEGRTCQLRGVNLCGNSKLPTSPVASTHVNCDFYNLDIISFVGRPFKLEQIDDHFGRLRAWGLSFVRFLVPWESL